MQCKGISWIPYFQYYFSRVGYTWTRDSVTDVWWVCLSFLPPWLHMWYIYFEANNSLSGCIACNKIIVFSCWFAVVTFSPSPNYSKRDYDSHVINAFITLCIRSDLLSEAIIMKNILLNRPISVLHACATHIDTAHNCHNNYVFICYSPVYLSVV